MLVSCSLQAVSWGLVEERRKSYQVSPTNGQLASWIATWWGIWRGECANMWKLKREMVKLSYLILETGRWKCRKKRIETFLVSTFQAKPLQIQAKPLQGFDESWRAFGPWENWCLKRACLRGDAERNWKIMMVPVSSDTEAAQPRRNSSLVSPI